MSRGEDERMVCSSWTSSEVKIGKKWWIEDLYSWIRAVNLEGGWVGVISSAVEVEVDGKVDVDVSKRDGWARDEEDGYGLVFGWAFGIAFPETMRLHSSSEIPNPIDRIMFSSSWLSPRPLPSPSPISTPTPILFLGLPNLFETKYRHSTSYRVHRPQGSPSFG